MPLCILTIDGISHQVELDESRTLYDVDGSTFEGALVTEHEFIVMNSHGTIAKMPDGRRFKAIVTTFASNPNGRPRVGFVLSGGAI